MQFQSFNFIYSVYVIQVIEILEAIQAIQAIVSQTPQLFPIPVETQAISNYSENFWMPIRFLWRQIDNNYN